MSNTTDRPLLIALFTDFGPRGIYTGQMEAVLAASGLGIPVIELCSDAPMFDPRAAAYLLAALAGEMPVGTLFICVVDPGVGGDRLALSVRADRQWFVGPDNGLLSRVVAQAEPCRIQTVEWSVPRLSDSFHGRDLFAPVAARISRGEGVPGTILPQDSLCGADWPADLHQVIYVDHYGNLFTGIRASRIGVDASIETAGRRLEYRRTFCDARPGEPFWYRNSIGLVELAVNGGRAVDLLGLAPGDRVRVAGR